jgi:hypothetical protein
MAASSPSQHRLSLRHNVQGTVYVLHFDPAYKHARHYIGWTEGDDVTARIAVHLQGRGSPLSGRPSRLACRCSWLRRIRGRGIWSGG